MEEEEREGMLELVSEAGCRKMHGFFFCTVFFTSFVCCLRHQPFVAQYRICRRCERKRNRSASLTLTHAFGESGEAAESVSGDVSRIVIRGDARSERDR